jgi:hypothetical protein
MTTTEEIIEDLDRSFRNSLFYYSKYTLTHLTYSRLDSFAISISYLDATYRLMITKDF